jgi:phosphatidylinositol alpha-1,6-mannosyltransferase
VELLQDDALRRRLGERGRDWVEEAWRWDILAARLRALL